MENDSRHVRCSHTRRCAVITGKHGFPRPVGKRWSRTIEAPLFSTAKNANIRRVGWRRCEVAYLNILLYIPGYPIGQRNAALISTHNGVEQWPRVGRPLVKSRLVPFSFALSILSPWSPFPFPSARCLLLRDRWELEFTIVEIIENNSEWWVRINCHSIFQVSRKLRIVRDHNLYVKRGYCSRRWMNGCRASRVRWNFEWIALWLDRVDRSSDWISSSWIFN